MLGSPLWATIGKDGMNAMIPKYLGNFVYMFFWNFCNNTVHEKEKWFVNLFIFFPIQPSFPQDRLSLLGLITMKTFLFIKSFSILRLINTNAGIHLFIEVDMRSSINFIFHLIVWFGFRITSRRMDYWEKNSWRAWLESKTYIGKIGRRFGLLRRSPQLSCC